jgi:hypothetical protein
VKKGVIMEVDERFLTLLTPEGEFLRARKQRQDYLIGEEIDFFPVSENKKKKSLFFNLTPGKALPAAACAFIIAAASFIPFNNSNDVYAYMSIDVNPSIELAVNDELEVIDLEAYNVEGKKILSEIKDWDHADVSVVTTNIIEEIKVQGFFENHDKVVISTVYDDKKEIKVKQKLEADIEKIEEKIEKENIQLTVLKATKQERKEAHKQGVSTGVYKEKRQTVDKKVKETQQEKTDSIKDVQKDKYPQKQKQSSGKVKSEDKNAKDEKENNGKQDANDVKKEDKKEKTKNQSPQKTKNKPNNKGKKKDNSEIEDKEKKTMDDDPKKTDDRKNTGEKKNNNKNKDKVNDKKNNDKKNNQKGNSKNKDDK